MPRAKPIEVVLEQAHCTEDNPRFFVLLRNVPWAGRSRSVVIPQNACPLAQAEVIKAAVENALHEYRRPPKRTPKKTVRKTSWDRITKERVLP
jgi:hypothetical protein